MSKPVSVLDIDRMQGVLERRAQKHGVALKFDDVDTAMTDGHTITIPHVGYPVTQEQLDMLYWFVIHECGHLSRSEAFDIVRAAKPNENLFGLYNITEDEGMEREIALMYRGDAAAMSQGYIAAISGVITRFKDNPIPDPLGLEDKNRLTAMNLLSRARYRAWDSRSLPMMIALEKLLPKEVLDFADELEREGWVDKFLATNGPHDTWDLACDLYKRLYPDVDEDEVEDKREKGHAMQDDEVDGDTDGSADQGDTSTQDGSEKGDGDIQGNKIPWDLVNFTDHTDREGGGGGIDWSSYQGGDDIELGPKNTVKVVDLRKPQGYCEKEYYQELFTDSSKSSRVLANKVRTYVQATRRTKFDPDKYSGRLNKQAVSRLLMPPIDGGEYNKKVFYDTSKRKAIDTCVHVLVDWSGSMIGDKMEYASKAAARLSNTFDKSLRIPTKVSAFSYRWHAFDKESCIIGVVKDWSDKTCSDSVMAGRFADFVGMAKGNNDADSLMWAYRDILKRKEKRKIIVVLSDGMPADSYKSTSSPFDNLKAVTDSIQDEGKVDLIGLGICDKSVKQYYKNNKVINSPEEINKALFSLIKEGIKQ